MKLPEDFEGFVLSDSQIFAAQFLQLASGPLGRFSKAIGVVVYVLVPFFYTFRVSRSNILRFVIYPLVYALPWTTYVIDKDAFQFTLINRFVPFVGLIYFFLGLSPLFSRPRSAKRAIRNAVCFLVLAVLAALAPIESLNPSGGIQLQLSWPFVTLENAIGHAFRQEYLKHNPVDMDFALLAVRPFMAHAWLFCICGALLSLLSILWRENKHKTAEEETLDYVEQEEPANNIPQSA